MKILWTELWSGDRSNPWGPGILYNLQYFGGRSGKGGSAGYMWSTGVNTWVGIGGGREQHSVVCRQWPHIGTQPPLGTGNSDGGGQNV